MISVLKFSDNLHQLDRHQTPVVTWVVNRFEVRAVITRSGVREDVCWGGCSCIYKVGEGPLVGNTANISYVFTSQNQDNILQHLYTSYRGYDKKCMYLYST